MAILNNCELWYVKLDPQRPDGRFDPKRPSWSVQLRTKDKNQRKQWADLQLRVKTVIDDETEEVSHRLNLSKKSVKENGEAANPVTVVDAQLQPLDPKIIGNGSIGNVRVYQYNFTRADGSKGTAAMLMGVQITKLVVRPPRAEGEGEFEAFSAAGQTVVEDPHGVSDGGGNPPAEKTAPAATSPQPAAPAAPAPTPAVVKVTPTPPPADDGSIAAMTDDRLF